MEEDLPAWETDREGKERVRLFFVTLNLVQGLLPYSNIYDMKSGFIIATD